MNNNNNNQFTEAGRQYAAAYAAQYKDRDLPRALQLYLKLLSSQSEAKTAEYARVQVRNIVEAVVSKEKVLAALVDLALAHFDCTGSSDTNRAPVAPLVPEMST